MPLNATTYLEQHGWRGKGIPLDGEKGRGLKKPLALPMKRNLKGVGKERDRAVEWWDCLFEAGAKKLQTSPAVTSKENVQMNDSDSKQSIITTSSSLSLAALAKREHARKLLMSGFVRGRPNEEYENKMKDLEKTLAQQEEERLAAKAKLVKHSALINSHVEESPVSASKKTAEKAERKEKRKRDKEASKQKRSEMKEYDERKKQKKEGKKAGGKASSESKAKVLVEDKEYAEKLQKKEKKRKEKEEKKTVKQKKDSKKNSSKTKTKDPSLKPDKENRKRKRSSDEK